VKELLQQYASYNVWANQRIVNTLLPLTQEKLHQPVVSSFNSLHLTLKHMWNTEQTWWQRVKLLERIQSIMDLDVSTEDVATALIAQSKQWEGWVNKNTTAGLEHVFAYQTFKGEHFKQPIFQMLLHVFNHQSYHRGQVVTILRQVGVETIPATDFILYSRGAGGKLNS